MGKLFCLFALLFCSTTSGVYAQKKKQAYKTAKIGVVKIIFNNLVNGRPLVLHDSVYTNSRGENYTVSKLKYYISNIGIYSNGKLINQKNSYHLIDESNTGSLAFSFAVPENNYDSIRFLLGVDSSRNVSGAQTGALDPLNDMFWTWNTGYVMFKLEGASPQSNIVNNKMEYHIGGFQGGYSILKFITLAFPTGEILKIKKGKTSAININADINQFWQGNISLKISDTPACSSPGLLAKQIAGNFAGMFTATIINNY